MTDNEIIKALNACMTTSCRECPLNNGTCEIDYGGVPSFIVDLINRLQAENSNLTSDLTSLKKDLTSAKAEIERLKAENKLLVENNISTKYPCCVSCSLGVILTKTLDDYDNLIGDISAEAIKAFVNKSETVLIELYKKYYGRANNTKKETDMFYQGRAEAIWEGIIVNRNLVKEMTGENNV